VAVPLAQGGRHGCCCVHPDPCRHDLALTARRGRCANHVSPPPPTEGFRSVSLLNGQAPSRGAAAAITLRITHHQLFRPELAWS